jgi:putative acyl-CoA dehydrogenase
MRSDVPLNREADNQPPPQAVADAYALNRALREAIAREGGGTAETQLGAYGAIAGGELLTLGARANASPPVLRPVDPYGRRIDFVEFHPAWHELMRLGIEHGVTGFAWRHAGREGAHVARAALMYLHYQAEQGSGCPLTMTYACVPTLRHAPKLAEEWIPRIIAPHYNGADKPAHEKLGNTIGMGMTEKQGGSDVRSNRTQATPASEGMYTLRGHKWFYSAPMCDAHLVLAQAKGGLSCFLLPRRLPDGELNGVRIVRLKDKLGDHSNASAEVEFEDARAWLVGEEGRGVANILQMVALTRLDCLIGSAALMRQALVQALHHTRHREAFGKKLVDQPLMRNVLCDLALESEAATALAMRTARSVDAAERGDQSEAALARVVTALGKYWVCKRATPFVNEAQECLGGIGYCEDTLLPRLLRQAPLNSIWEGSGNIQCLDLLRALKREPACRDALFDEINKVRGADARLDAEVAKLANELDATNADEQESRARWLAERLAITLQASILLRAGNNEVSGAFCASRLGERRSLAFGTLEPNLATPYLLERALPV